jgi:hypothetical protein
VFNWGKTVKTDIDKNGIDKLIKNYVDKKYPKKVKLYHNELLALKNSKIAKYKDTTFVNNNLMWEDTKLNKTKLLNHLESINYCKELDLANREDWRVPRYSELLDLVDYTKAKPASLDKIKYIVPKKYWSVSASIKKKRYSWYVRFKYGKTDIANNLDRLNIRCVRDISKIEGEY